MKSKSQADAADPPIDPPGKPDDPGPPEGVGPDNELPAPEPAPVPQPELPVEGRCIETNGDGFTIRSGPLEHHFVMPGHVVEPGQYVRIAEDGTLELVGAEPPAPPDTKIPSQPQPMK